MKTSDGSLWEGLRQGEKSAFDQIYYLYVKLLFNYGKRYTANDELIEDCIQNLFTDLWVKRKKLGKTNNIKAYLLLSIKRRILRQIGIQQKKLMVHLHVDFVFEFSVEDKMIQEANHVEKVKQLNRTLTKLTPKQKEVIYLKFYEDLSYKEIAEIMNVEIKAIYKITARALNFLKENFTMLVFYWLLS